MQVMKKCAGNTCRQLLPLSSFRNRDAKKCKDCEEADSAKKSLTKNKKETVSANCVGWNGLDEIYN